jgi:hypothetical protein
MFAGILEIVVNDQGGVFWQCLICPSAAPVVSNVNVVENERLLRLT